MGDEFQIAFHRQGPERYLQPLPILNFSFLVVKVRLNGLMHIILKFILTNY